MNHILIIGLGNPGENYEDTRHNIGFKLTDAISEKFNFPSYSNKFSSLVSSKIINHNKITLIKPQTYMNLSGNSVSKLAHFYKIPTENIIVLHDDLDLAFLKVKMKIGGGAGGHNGIKSIDQHIGEGYYRVRIGIGKPLHSKDVSNFVLDNFSKEEQNKVQELIYLIIDNFDLMIEKNMPMFMYNTKSIL
ncbi:MAG: aminoacyl-tRNA hydrolase [Pseudomonadota bacterium]